MEIKDARGKSIEIGFHIRYTGTGTIGKVRDLRIDEDDAYSKWVKLEKPNLWYSTDLVEVIDEKNLKTKGHHIEREEDIENLKDIGNDLGDASLTSGGAEGGG